MPRYFIDSDDDDLLVVDDAGFDVSGPEEARSLAISILPDMARDKLPDGDRRTFKASLRDEAGTVIYEATLTLVGEWKIKLPSP